MNDVSNIDHDKIIVEKIVRGVYVAKCNVLKPIRAEVTMKGKSEEVAKKKLILFLEGKPYSHLD